MLKIVGSKVEKSVPPDNMSHSMINHVNADLSILYFLKRNIIANYLRIVTRLYAFFHVIGRVLLENI